MSENRLVEEVGVMGRIGFDMKRGRARQEAKASKATHRNAILLSPFLFSVTPLRLCVSVVMIFLFSLPAHAQLLAGASRVDMTPDVKARSIPLGGYAARRGAPATGVHDAVYARTLVLAQGDVKLAIVSLDLCFLPANVKTEVAKRLATQNVTGLDAAHLFLSATHTHSAPDPLAMHSGNTFTNLKGWTPFDRNLLDFTADKIAQAIAQANRVLVPATLATAVQDENGANRNRRGDTVVDPALTLLKVQKMDGRLLALVVDFAAHPTLYDDKMMQISADWPGVMCADLENGANQPGAEQEVKQAVRPDAAPQPASEAGRSSEVSHCVCLFLNGAEGDASPNGVDEEKGEDKVTAYGHRMSKLVTALLAKATPASHAANTSTGKPVNPNASIGGAKNGGANEGNVKIWTQAVTLPPRKPSGLFFVAAMQLGASMPQARDLVNGLMPTATQITFAQVGGLLLIGFPCEPSGAIGLEAKRMARTAGYKTPAVVALTNDWLAYCLTPEQYRAGKYESVMSFYGEPFGPAMLDGVKAGLAKK